MLIVEGHVIRNYSEPMTDAELHAFCAENRELHIERDAQQNIIIMAPVGGVSGFYESELITSLTLWRRATGQGLAFSSATGFLLPNGAMRAPDAAWLSAARWAALSEAQQEGFLPVVPNFVVELRSASDVLERLQHKMVEWIAQGVELAWLVDPVTQSVQIYQPGQPARHHQGFRGHLSGDPVLPGFTFDLALLRRP